METPSDTDEKWLLGFSVVFFIASIVFITIAKNNNNLNESNAINNCMSIGGIWDYGVDTHNQSVMVCVKDGKIVRW